MSESDDRDLVLLEAAADPVRLAILRRLSADGPARASDLLAAAEVSQPTISHHLKVLRTAGWIEGERRGRTVLYRLRIPAVERLRAFVDDLWSRGPGRPVDAPPGSETSGSARAPVAKPAPIPTDWRQW